MDFAEIALVALQVLSPVLLAGLTWLGTRVAALIQARVTNEYLRRVLIRLDDAVFTAVKDLQQTVVAEIRIASADGKISDVDRRRIKAAAIANVKSHLGAKGIAEMGRILGLGNGALDGLIGSKVEAAVHDIRVAANGATGKNGVVGPFPAASAS